MIEGAVLLIILGALVLGYRQVIALRNRVAALEAAEPSPDERAAWKAAVRKVLNT